MDFLHISIKFNMAQVLGFIPVFFYHFGNIDPGSWMTSLMVFLVTFMFLRGLGLGLRIT